MTKLKLRDKRKKAQFGESIVAAGIQAAATAASAIMGAAATAKASKEQAAAQEASAKSEAEALQAQNENNNRLQKQQIEATKLENEKIRTLEESNQETLQMLAGMQNTNARKDAAKIQAKYGTILQTPQVVAPMDGNMPVITKDGGYLQFLRKSNTGKDIYLAIGAKHNQKHKARNGKPVGGIGLELPLFNTKPKTNLEVEGGEIVTVGNNEVDVSTTHDIHHIGKSPAQQILNGADPDYVNYKQEIAKLYSKINDDGTKMKNIKRKKHTAGGIVQPFPPQPNFVIAGSTTPIGGIIASQKQDVPQFKYGGRIKADDGILNKYKGYQTGAAGFNALGAGLAATSNIIGNTIGSYFSRRGVNRASDILYNAYRNLKGIDTNLTKDLDKRALAMAALQAPIVNTGADRASIERSTAKATDQIQNNTISSAAAINRMSNLNSSSQDLYNKVEQNAYNKKQDIIGSNTKALNEISMFNAEQKNRGAEAKLNADLRIAEYNADIKNQSTLGVGETEANRHRTLGDITANTWISNMQNIGNSLEATGKGFAEAGRNIGKANLDYNMAIAKAGPQEAVNLMMLNNDNDGVLNKFLQYNANEETKNDAFTNSMRDYLKQTYLFDANGNLVYDENGKPKLKNAKI